MKLQEKGLSLIEILIAISLLGGVSLGVMQLMKMTQSTQSHLSSKSDEIELRSAVNLILSDEKHCRVSIAGDGPVGNPSTPVTFKKSENDEDNGTEGLEVELFYANQTGDSRSKKRVSADVNSVTSRFGKIEISSIYLLMNNGVGTNYAQSPSHTDIGQLIVEGQKNIDASSSKDFKFSFDVNVAMKTNSAGVSTILSCTKEGSVTTIEYADYSLGTSAGWMRTNAWGSDLSCLAGQVYVGMCSSGKNKDCNLSGTNQASEGKCAPLQGDFSIDDSMTAAIQKNLYHTGRYGDRVQCPAFHVITSYCGSGKNADCSSSVAGGNVYTEITCKPLEIPEEKRVGREIHRYRATSNWNGRLECDYANGYYLTGVCTSGEDRDCRSFGVQTIGKKYAKSIRCTKVVY